MLPGGYPRASGGGGVGPGGGGVGSSYPPVSSEKRASLEGLAARQAAVAAQFQAQQQSSQSQSSQEQSSYAAMKGQRRNNRPEVSFV